MVPFEGDTIHGNTHETIFPENIPRTAITNGAPSCESPENTVVAYGEGPSGVRSETLGDGKPPDVIAVGKETEDLKEHKAVIPDHPVEGNDYTIVPVKAGDVDKPSFEKVIAC